MGTAVRRDAGYYTASIEQRQTINRNGLSLVNGLITITVEVRYSIILKHSLESIHKNCFKLQKVL